MLFFLVIVYNPARFKKSAKNAFKAMLYFPADNIRRNKTALLYQKSNTRFFYGLDLRLDKYFAANNIISILYIT